MTKNKTLTFQSESLFTALPLGEINFENICRQCPGRYVHSFFFPPIWFFKVECPISFLEEMWGPRVTGPRRKYHKTLVTNGKGFTGECYSDYSFHTLTELGKRSNNECKVFFLIGTSH